MKMKKWLKCLLMTMALMMAVSAGTVTTTLPAAAKAKTAKAAATVKKGTKFWKGNYQYKVTSLKGKKGTAALVGAKSKVTSVNVPKTVQTGKYTLTVTAIGDNAFKNCKKLKKVVTNTTLKEIGKNAFYGCKKLTAVEIKSKVLSKVGKNALAKVSSKIVVKVPEGKGTSYKKLLKVSVQAPKKAQSTAKAKSTTKVQSTVKAQSAAPAQSTVKAQSAAPAQSTAKVQSAAPVQSTVKAQSAAPAQSTAKAQSAAPTQSTAKAQSAAPAQSTVEAQSAAPAQSTVKAQSAAPAQSTAKVQSTAPAQSSVKAQSTAAVQNAAPAQDEEPAEDAAPTEDTAPAEDKNAEPSQNTAEVQSTPETQEASDTIPEKDSEPVCGKKHLGLKVVESVAPTCTTAGMSSYEYCTVCGYETKPIPLSALGHDFGGWTVAKAASCTAAGTEERSCATCGAKETRPIRATGHSFGDWTVVKAASCTAEGIEKRTCACGAEETRSIAKTGHTYGEWRQEHIAGSHCYDRNVRECTVCGYMDSKTGAIVHRTDVLEHLADIEPTCTEDGKTNRTYCPYCKLENFRRVGRLGHDFSDVRTVEEGTCVKPGISYRKCTRCDAKTDIKETRAADGHQWRDVSEPASCTEAGFKGRECSVCGERDGKVTNPLGHKYETTVKAATCEENGLKTTRCSVCGTTKLETIEATGKHQWVKYEEQPATCSKEGHSAYEQCSICGTYKDGAPKTYEATGVHTWARDTALYNTLSTAEKQSVNYLKECNAHYGLKDTFVKCTGCDVHCIARTDGGHDWNSEGRCSFVDAAFGRNGIETYHFIQITAFLVEKGASVQGVSSSVFYRPFEVLVNGMKYDCYILLRRSDKGTVETYAPKVFKGDSAAQWRQVTKQGESLTWNGEAVNSHPFYEADGNIYLACF